MQELMDTLRVSMPVQGNYPTMQRLLDMLPFGVVFLDHDLRILSLNKFMADRLAGFKRLQANTPVEQILGEGQERTLQAFRMALAEGQPLTLSARFHRAIFNLIPAAGLPTPAVPQSVSVMPLILEPHSNGLVVVVQDVSDRVLAEEELKREIRKFAFLHELDLALSTLEVNACMETLVTRVRAMFDADFAALLVHENGRLTVIASDGLALPSSQVSIEASQGLTGWVFLNRQPVCVGNVMLDDRYHPLFDTIRSEMSVPLLAGGQCIGVLNLESSAQNAFTESDLKLLEMAAFSAANALQNAKMHAEANYWRAYYQGVINQTSDIIYTVDRDLRITGVNHAWDAFARENQGEAWLSPDIVGRELLSAFSGNEREKWRTICAELLNGERSVYSEDIPCHSPEKERWFTLQAHPLKTVQGSVSGVIFSTHDISEHVIAERRLRTANYNLETILRVSQVLNQNVPNQNVPQITTEILAEVLQADCVTITAFDEQEQAFRVIAAHGASERHIREFRSPSDQAERIIRSFGKTGTIYDLENSVSSINMPIYRADQLNGMLYSLIEHQGKTIGSLNIFIRSAERRFTAEEISLVQSISPQVALAMENARLYEVLHQQATTDGLTGLANRRQMDDLLALELQRSKRYDHPLVVMMMDLDHFKCYNDTFGHAVGDELLKQIARAFKRTLRMGDIAARYGGDEFAIILPETNLQNAPCVAKRLKEAMASVQLFNKEEAGCRPLTLSIGVAAYPEHGGESADLLRCADQALYRAKQLGRNRIEIYQPNWESGDLQEEVRI